ncbi:helix-turn-helix transcriptional regulator [Actinoplanes sp. HUAS TT8]|uniref:helix-turn-helix transcriptional regulator n=1 Tax=Actinoplanes sp. HUAS TT8 TaxID=3447453 RepID=UPI003F51EACF
MDNRAEIREFLASRRAKITPEQVGLPAGTGLRRVPGLRREEVAVLAGVSTDWYVRLEKGHIDGVSDDVLDAVARALHLDDAERLHLFNLARAAKPQRANRTRRTPPALHDSVRRVIDAMSTPAFVRNGRLDVLAINTLGRALYAPVFEDPTRPANMARFCFLDPASQTFYPDWAQVARATVAVLRAAAGRDPHDRDLTDLVGELATRSDVFRTEWASHNVTLHQHGHKHFQHPIVGRIDVTFDSMPLPADPGLTLTAYSTEPGSPSEQALNLLASWTAPGEQPNPTRTGETTR